MVRGLGRVVALVLAMAVAALAMGMGGTDKPKATPIKEALPFIKCEVCEHYVEEIVKSLRNLRENALKGNIEEIAVAETLDAACKPTNQTGEWIRTLDIASIRESGKTFLRLQAPGGTGKCGRDCMTIAQSCEDLLENDLDADDLSAYLWKRKSYSVKEVQKKVCKEMSGRCGKATVQPVPKNLQIPESGFEPMSDKEVEMERMLASMKEMGMGGSMYNREDMMNMNLGDMYGDDEDEDGYGGQGMGDVGGMMGGQEF